MLSAMDGGYLDIPATSVFYVMLFTWRVKVIPFNNLLVVFTQ